MKNRIIALLAIIAVFGLAVFAYAQTTSVNSGRSCCTKDSCPIKKEDASAKETASCCDNCDCCKDEKCTGDSCPMKKKGDKAQMSMVSMSSDKPATTADGCCCSCCGDSCPMKKKDAKVTTVSATDGKDCCCCCKAKKGTAV